MRLLGSFFPDPAVTNVRLMSNKTVLEYDPMSNDQQYLTPEGAQKLRAELEELVNVKRPELARQLKEAIAMGDLSENADYNDAKEQQAFLEGRIRYLEGLLRSATIIDGETTGGIVSVGSEVTIQEEDFDPETYRIVGAAEANPSKGLISNESPLGAALLGKKPGQKVKVQTPSGLLTFVVKAIN
jgi:transcription elongation factor GreA